MKLDGYYFVYIVECLDGSYYTGITNDIERRLWEHNSGFDQTCYTYKRRPVTLKYSVEINDVDQAILWEKQIKGWSRKKKEALFVENWEEIQRLAKSGINNSKSALNIDYSQHPSTGSG